MHVTNTCARRNFATTPKGCLFAMLTVYHAVLTDDKCQGSYKLKDLVQFGEKATRSEEFQLWFSSSNSLIWTPQKQPPTCSSSDESFACKPDDDSTCEGTAEFSPKYNCVTNTGECKQSENTMEDINHAGISPLLKRLLDKDTLSTSHVTPSESLGIKWCSCPTNKIQEVYQESQSQPLLMDKLEEKASTVGFPPNCRGKWIILVSDLSNEFSLEDLWKDISKEICTGVVHRCTASFQTDPSSQVLVYTDFLCCAAVPEHFRCIRERVRQMSYVVHPHGEVLSWDGKEINF